MLHYALTLVLVDVCWAGLHHRAALGKPLDLYDIASIDPALGASLQRLDAALTAHVAGGGQGPLLVDGCTLEDMCLTFTLPGGLGSRQRGGQLHAAVLDQGWFVPHFLPVCLLSCCCC